MNVLKPHKKATIATLIERRLSQREIERVTGVNRRTIRSMQREMAAEAAKCSTPSTGSNQSAPPRPPGPAWSPSACEPHRAFIEAQVLLRRNATSIYQDLVDLYGFTSAYASVKRFVRTLKRIEPEQFDRLEFDVAEECQVDYGEGAPTFDPKTGRYKKPRLFVMTLRYSGRCFRRVVWKSSQETWAQLHEQGWRYFGGCTTYVVLDNLREGVIKPDLYEPELNPVYSEVLAHYGVVADPARVGDPNRKGAVENAIQHTQNTALKGRRFESIEEQNAHLEHWETRWAATRIHGTTKRQVEAMFQEERSALRPLPLQGFQYFKQSEHTVYDDGCVRVDYSSYAARPARIGSKVLVRLFEHHLEIRDLHSQELLRTHARSHRPGSVAIPDSERLFNPSRETHRILAQAVQIGPSVARLCQGLFEREGRMSQRRLWGIVGLVRRYPRSMVDQACAIALHEGVPSYHQIKALTERMFLDAVANMDAPMQGELPLTQNDPLIRSGDDYADLFTLGADQSASLTTNPEEAT